MTKLNAVKAIFKKWKKHRLTLYGKNVIIKSLGGSGFSFLFSVLPIGLIDPQTLMFSKLFLTNMNILRDYWPFKMIL